MNSTPPAQPLQRALNELQAEQQRTAQLNQRLRQQDGELMRLRATVSRESNSRLMAEEALDETQDRLGLAVAAAKLALLAHHVAGAFDLCHAALLRLDAIHDSGFAPRYLATFR